MRGRRHGDRIGHMERMLLHGNTGANSIWAQWPSNRLHQQFAASAPNQVWLADISYIATDDNAPVESFFSLLKTETEVACNGPGIFAKV